MFKFCLTKSNFEFMHEEQLIGESTQVRQLLSQAKHKNGLIVKSLK